LLEISIFQRYKSLPLINPNKINATTNNVTPPFIVIYEKQLDKELSEQLNFGQ
jgi:hypothetical protein